AMGTKAYTAQEIQQHAQAGGQGSGPVTDQGVGAIQPSGSMQSLNHSAFSMSYPSNWKAYGDQQSAVTIAPENGISQDAVAYGVIINGGNPEGNSLDEVTHQIVSQLKQGNPDLRTIG